jgi:hypothetical protein
MTEDELMKLIADEMDRQYQELRDGPYTFNSDADTTRVDGRLHLRQLAKAILAAVESQTVGIRQIDLGKGEGFPE